MPKKMKTVKKPKSITNNRPTSTQRGYDRGHRSMRQQLLALHPVCQHCNREFSEHAHHLRYPARSLDDYQALCSTCHSRHHLAERQ